MGSITTRPFLVSRPRIHLSGVTSVVAISSPVESPGSIPQDSSRRLAARETKAKLAFGIGRDLVQHGLKVVKISGKSATPPNEFEIIVNLPQLTDSFAQQFFDATSV